MKLLLSKRLALKRGLLALAGVGLLGLLGLAACGLRGHHEFGEADRARLQQRLLERAGSKLDLDATQRAHLEALLTLLSTQQQLLSPKGQIAGLLAGPSFDQAAAQRLIDSKTALLHEQSPVLIKAVAAFYDGLRPEQQARLRELLKQPHHGWRG